MLKFSIGLKQVTIISLCFAPDWLLQDAIDSELDTNWKYPYVSVLLSSLPPAASIISSRFILKIKDGDHELISKGRLVLHGNRDRERFIVRSDSTSQIYLSSDSSYDLRLW